MTPTQRAALSVEERLELTERELKELKTLFHDQNIELLKVSHWARRLLLAIEGRPRQGDTVESTAAKLREKVGTKL